MGGRVSAGTPLMTQQDAMLDDKSSYRTIRLEKIRFGMLQTFQEKFLDANAELFTDYLLAGFRVRVNGYLWGESVKTYTVRYPKDWKEALKEKWYAVDDYCLRWIPASFKRKHPVIYTVHDFDLKALYPDIKVSLPSYEHSLMMAQYTNNDTDFSWKDFYKDKHQ